MFKGHFTSNRTRASDEQLDSTIKMSKLRKTKSLILSVVEVRTIIKNNKNKTVGLSIGQQHTQCTKRNADFLLRLNTVISRFAVRTYKRDKHRCNHRNIKQLL